VTPVPNLTSGNLADTPTRLTGSPQALDRPETAPPNDPTTQFDCQPENFEVIYPPTIHLSDLRWKPDPEGEVAPALDDFIARLVSAVTEPGCFPQLNLASPYRKMPTIIEDSFMMPATPEQTLRQQLDKIVSQCRAEEVVRSERLIVCAVEGALPFWELFSSMQRILKITVRVELPNQQQAGLCKVAVRIEPFHPEGPGLHPRILDIRSQLLRTIRAILEAAPERRRTERLSCNFGVELYPILRNWRFGPCLAARAVDLSAQGIGLTALAQPSTNRFYLRPAAPNPLSDYAVLAEVVRHSLLPNGSFAWGMALGRI